MNNDYYRCIIIFPIAFIYGTALYVQTQWWDLKFTWVLERFLNFEIWESHRQWKWFLHIQTLQINNSSDSLRNWLKRENIYTFTNTPLMPYTLTDFIFISSSSAKSSCLPYQLRLLKIHKIFTILHLQNYH